MQFQFYKPGEILTQFIRNYWSMESDISEPDVCERVIPTGNVNLLFHYRKPFVIKYSPASAYSQVQPQSLISGLSNTYFDVSTHGDAGVIAVNFLPLGACRFFRFPLNEIENQSLDLRAIYNREILEVEEKIGSLSTQAERIKLIELFLISKLSTVRESDFTMVGNGVHLIWKHCGQLSTVHLSKLLAVTPKTLERKFAALLGKTPKQYFRLVRFQKTLYDIGKTPAVDLTDYAYRNGYYDQSHFIKEFKTFTGYTPSEFIHLCSPESLAQEVMA